MRQSRRILALLLCAIMLFGMIPVSASAAGTAGFDNFKKVNTYTDGKFSDVKTGNWYADNVKAAYEFGLMIGQGTKFGVDSDVTIAETVTLAARLHSAYVGDGKVFEQGSVWYQVYADYVKEKSLFDLSGLDMIAIATRAQYAAILSAALPDEALKSINNVADDAIPDVKTGDAYAAAIYKLYRAGILTGTDSKGTYQPNNKIKRSEVSAIVTRMADQSLRMEVTLGNFCKVTFNDGTSSQIITVETGKTVSAPKNPTKSGYSFGGWNTAASGGTRFDFSTIITSDITLFAHWNYIRTGGGYTPPSNKNATAIKISTNNLGNYVNQDVDTPYYAINEDFDGEIRGTLSPGADNVQSISYTIQDDQNNELKKGDIIVGTTWSFSEVGFSIGFNTITVTALLTDGSSLTDSVMIGSYSPELMENISVDETDSDDDGLNNYLEGYYGTDKNNPDSDDDGLSDFIEIAMLNGYNPLSKDSDSNGVNDGEEDYDGDGLTNAEEIAIGTDLALLDSDGDGLSDFDEVKTYLTRPLKSDSDDDGSTDGWEIANGYDPLVYDAAFPATIEATTPTSSTPITAGVTTEVYGVSPDTVVVSAIESRSNPLISTEIAGYLGQAYEFTAGGEINSAVITFRYDDSLGEIGDNFQPRIYYLNEVDGTLEELENQTVVPGEVSATVTHFSTYILLNKIDVDSVWENDIKSPISGGDPSEEPILNIVFVIDYSASMEWNDPSQLCKQLSKEFVSKLRDDEDQAAVIKFIRRATVVCDLTSDKSALNNAIDSISYDDGYGSYSGTDGSTGLKSALDSLSTSCSDYNYVIFITDGEDNGFTYSYDSLIERAVDMGVIVYTVGMGTANEGVLSNIAAQTGGKYYHATASVDTEDLIDLDEVFKDIESETVDLTTDSNHDGIPDYFNDLLLKGTLVLSNGSDEFKGINFNFDSKGNPSDDYDGDGLKNGEELVVQYNEKNGKVMVRLNSSPLLSDTDGDGLLDGSDDNPLSWDVCGRDLAMLAALTYEDGSSYVGKFYDASKVDEDYYWLDFASIGELSSRWKIADHTDTWTQAAHLDKFSATTYTNGNNVVIAYRGTNDGLWEWADNVLCYGLVNYHAEEALTQQYANAVYNTYVKGKPNVKLYITGHSLGGYLAQIGAAKLIMDGHSSQLEKVAYFNGIGMKYDKLLFWTKNDEINALKDYCDYDNGLFKAKTTNGKLISYHINGDWVSMLGTHYGDEVGFDATPEARANHAGQHGTYSSFWEAIKTFTVSTVGVAVGTVAASPAVLYYYGYYAPQSFIEYTWITHETDSFLYYLTQGSRNAYMRIGLIQHSARCGDSP